ncbi:conserved hypothetical protein [Histoplasma capsulatum var. duboisii H88]|uniref:BTB domain-containing protein n=1 Tax=Ajellomyces capsulatus (strain H88) TaxID=544711 RepID=F0UDD3_AJEC8|nr:conserved hypothetical protein [Histoplasma capsulatum var. duboisii H88]
MNKLWHFYPKIHPIRPLKPGECFLIQYRDKGQKELWIGVICSNLMIPDEAWRHCPVGSPPRAGQWTTQLDRRHYPIYLPKKGRIIWAHFIHLFEIHRSRYDEFESCPDFSVFCEVLNLALKGRDVVFWERMALGEFKERKEMIRLTTAGGLQPRSTTTTTLIKTTQQVRSSPTQDGCSLSGESIEEPVAQVSQATQLMKTADSQRIRCKEPLLGRVDVYIGVGTSRKIYNIPRHCVAKSGLLESSLMRKNQTTTASDPILDNTSHADFAVLLSFLEIGEYTPQLITSRKSHHHLENKPSTSRNRGITFYLEGLVTHEEHENEVLRCGYIYTLAQTFEIPALQALVLRKLRLGFPVISYKTMLTMIAYVFPRLDTNHITDANNPNGTGSPPAAPPGTLAEHYAKEEEPLRAYLVEWLVVNMVAASRVEGRLYWDTVSRFEGLKKTVMIRAAEMEIEEPGKCAAGHFQAPLGSMMA